MYKYSAEKKNNILYATLLNNCTEYGILSLRSLTISSRINLSKFFLLTGWKISTSTISLARHCLQIVHCQSSHWISVSSIGWKRSDMKVYDSLYMYNRVDNSSMQKINKSINEWITLQIYNPLTQYSSQYQHNRTHLQWQFNKLPNVNATLSPTV